jgi:hypothetical protein
MAHWPKSYPPTSPFNSFAGWAIGASVLLGGARVHRSARVRVESGLDGRELAVSE